MAKKAESEITTKVYIKGVNDIPPLLTKSGDTISVSEYCDLRKYLTESLRDQEFFNKVYNYSRFDIYNPKIILCKETIAVIGGKTFYLNNDEITVNIPASMDLLSKIIVFALDCGAYIDRDMNDYDRSLKELLKEKEQ